jgi:hypothetical protein
MKTLRWIQGLIILLMMGSMLVGCGGDGNGDSNDTTAPVITLKGDNPMNIVVGHAFHDPGATAKDEVDGIVTVTASGTVDTTKIAPYTIIYTAKDQAGNKATKKRTVNVIVAPDTTKPTITLIGQALMYHQKKLPFNDPGATAQDDTDGDITTHISASNGVNINAAGTYTIKYSVSDAASNAATPITRTIKVVESIIKKTGQTQSYDASGAVVANIKDDGHYQSSVAPDYVRNDAAKTVLDRVTGLEWEDDTLVKRAFDPAIAYCESLSLGQHDDWRLPSIRELMNITQHVDDPIPTIFKSRDSATNYWSNTENKANTTKAWGISMSSGTDSSMPKIQEKYVRCARGERATHHTLERDDARKIVIDPNVGLEWQDNETPPAKKWTPAITYCETLGLDGGGWRVPNYNERFMMLDRTRADAMDPLFVKRTGDSDFYWTSTTYKGDTSNALIISEHSGGDKWYDKNANYRIRCVRNAQ